MSEDDPLRDLLDGNISAEELEAIRASPDLRKLALRMYGDSVLELLGEEIIPEAAVDEPDLDLEMVEVIPETVPVVRASIDSASARKSGVNTSSGKSGILLTLGGIGGLGIGLTNVYWGLGNIIPTCADTVHQTCGISLKLNWASAHLTADKLGWSPVGTWGIPDMVTCWSQCALIGLQFHATALILGAHQSQMVVDVLLF